MYRGVGGSVNINRAVLENLINSIKIAPLLHFSCGLAKDNGPEVIECIARVVGKRLLCGRCFSLPCTVDQWQIRHWETLIEFHFTFTDILMVLTDCWSSLKSDPLNLFRTSIVYSGGLACLTNGTWPRVCYVMLVPRVQVHKGITWLQGRQTLQG